MANELQKITSQPVGFPTDMPQEAVFLQGEKPVYAKHIDQMNVTIQMAASTPKLLNSKVPSDSIDFDRRYYNIFVVGDDFDIKTDNPFKVRCDRVLREYINEEIKPIFLPLSDDSKIEQIKRLPCLFANENRYDGHTTEDQVMSFGYVRDIQPRRDGIKVYPHVMYLLKQQRMNEHLFDLDLWGSNKSNEFNRMHWSIKKVDLIAELHEMGYQL